MTLMKAIINLVNPLMQLQNMQQKLQKIYKTIGKGMTASITAPLTGIGIVSKNAFYI